MISTTKKDLSGQVHISRSPHHRAHPNASTLCDTPDVVGLAVLIFYQVLQTMMEQPRLGEVILTDVISASYDHYPPSLYLRLFK